MHQIKVLCYTFKFRTKENVTKSIRPTANKKSWQTASNFLPFDSITKKKCFSSKKSQFRAFIFCACMVISQCVAVMMCSNQGESIHEKGVKYVQTMCNKSPIISLSLSSYSQHSHFTGCKSCWIIANYCLFLHAPNRVKKMLLFASLNIFFVLRRFCSNAKMACIGKSEKWRSRDGLLNSKLKIKWKWARIISESITKG